MIKSTLAGAVAALAFVSLSGTGNAAGRPAPEELSCDMLLAVSCGVELEGLCLVTEGATSLKDRDRNTLLSKVYGAGIKIGQDKPEDASYKLWQYETKVDELVNAPKPKISEADADMLTDSLVPAQLCVDGLVSG